MKSIEAIKAAAESLGLGVREAEVKGQGTYKWFGRSVGDYPVPAGIKVADIGKNADYTLFVKPEKCAELKIDQKTVYEIGIVWSKTDKCYYPLYDFWAGGHGMSQVVGSPHENKDGVLMATPKLSYWYFIHESRIAAEKAGHKTHVFSGDDPKLKAMLKARGVDMTPNPNRPYLITEPKVGTKVKVS